MTTEQLEKIAEAHASHMDEQLGAARAEAAKLTTEVLNRLTEALALLSKVTAAVIYHASGQLTDDQLYDVVGIPAEGRRRG